MREVEETPLPGVGLRLTFTTTTDRRVTVVVHNTGRRELFLDVPGDPDASEQVLELDEEDSRVLADLLGGSQIVRDLDRLQRLGDDIALDWIAVEAASPAAGRTIGQLRIRSTTGVTVVAVLRGGETIPAPGPELELRPADTLVVAGHPPDIRRVHDLVRG